MVWIERHLKDQLVPPSCHRQGHLLLDEMKKIYNVQSLLLEISEVFIQTGGSGIPSAEQKVPQMSVDTLHSRTPEEALLLLGY